jgi:DNA-binding NarL/FixJ family response regulator
VSVRIVYAEPRRLLREAVTESLRDLFSIEATATDGDLAATLLQVARIRPTVVMTSGALQEHLPALCNRLRAEVGPPRVLVLDGPGSDARLLHAIESGAAGYITGHGGLTAVSEAVEALARGESVVPPAMLGTLLRRLIERQREAAQAAERLVALTPREREVLALLVEGRDPAGIAAVLYISPETAKTHVQRVLRKLGVHSRAEAIALAATTGLADRLERMVERSAS